MSASDNSHLKTIQFYSGLVPGKQEFLDMQEPTRDALRRVNQRFFSDTAKTSRVPVVTIPAAAAPDNFILRVAQNAGIQEDGYTVDWEGSIDFDCKTSTHGTTVGATTPGAGNKRYVIIAAKHEYEEADARPDKLLNTVYYQNTSTTTLRVYQTSDQSMADDWTQNTTLSDLLASIRSTDFCVPLAIAERKDGTTEFVSADVYTVDSTILPASIVSTTSLVEQAVGRAVQGYVVSTVNDNGQIAATPNAVGGQPGTVSIAGGEKIVLSIPALGDSGEFRGISKREFTLPASTATLLAADSQHIIRVKYNSATDNIVVYVGYGSNTVSSTINNTFKDAAVTFNPFATYNQADTGLGTPATSSDVPLLEVFTGTLGTAPIVKTISNHGLASEHIGYIDTKPLYRGNRFTNSDEVTAGIDRILSVINTNGSDADQQGSELAFGIVDETDANILGSVLARQAGAGTNDGELVLTTAKSGVRADRIVVSENGEVFILASGEGLPAGYAPGTEYSLNIIDTDSNRSGILLANENTTNSNNNGERLLGISFYGRKEDNTAVDQGSMVFQHVGAGNDNDSGLVIRVSDASTPQTAITSVGSEQTVEAYSGNGAWIGANTPIAVASFTESGGSYTLVSGSLNIDESVPGTSEITYTSAGVLRVNLAVTMGQLNNPVIITCGIGGGRTSTYTWPTTTGVGVFIFDSAGTPVDGNFSILVFGQTA